MIKSLHMALALLSVTGFVLRAGWRFTAPDLLKQKWVKISPHIIDTCLLVLGVWLALSLAEGVGQAWLIAKLVGLLAYIGFGVLCMRGTGPLAIVGLVGALLSVAYIFAVAFSRTPLPFL